MSTQNKNFLELCIEDLKYHKFENVIITTKDNFWIIENTLNNKTIYLKEGGNPPEYDYKYTEGEDWKSHLLSNSDIQIFSFVSRIKLELNILQTN